MPKIDLATKTDDQLVNLRENASRLGEQELLQQIPSEMERRHPRSREQVGGLWWDKYHHAHADFHAYLDHDGGTRVASIRMIENHRTNNGGVYTVHVGEHTHPDKIRNVADARRLGSEIWQRMRA